MHATAAASASTAFPPAAFAPTAVSWPEVVAHRGYLVRFAQRRLHDPMLAEDVVHDVFEAVLTGRASFGGRAALRSCAASLRARRLASVSRVCARTSPACRLSWPTMLAVPEISSATLPPPASTRAAREKLGLRGP